VNECDCIGAIGASGTGKGLFVSERVRIYAGRLVLVWSPLEYPRGNDRYVERLGGVPVRTAEELVARIREGKKAIVFIPDDTGARVKYKGKTRPLVDIQFELFCLTAWQVGKPGGVPQAVVIVEELSRVTDPSYAPAPWQNLSTAGRHRGLTVIGTSQHPAQIDKDFLGNCTEVRCYRVNEEAHARVMAAKLRAPADLILELPDYHYLHRWNRELRWERGVIACPGKSQAKVMAKGNGAYSESPSGLKPYPPFEVDRREASPDPRKKKLPGKRQKSR